MIPCMISPECLIDITLLLCLLSTQTGGFRPPVRKRHRLSLSLDEREEITRGLVEKRSIKEIANKLSRAPSTIRREIQRHGGATYYRAAKADRTAWDNALRPRPCQLIESLAL
ncbi:helix-turn-helix domain-containing protein (plasmid) [Pantoea sp. C3]|uniref:helix-turn-helix domain-containing protein n=1 Tax=Pantoea phytostimulans TaxID=2769024 RepID=UPI0038F70297